jgi:predicted transposase/invertase (TIGR01784 family)
MEGEIMDIIAYMFDEENNKRLFGLEQWRLGEEKGREEGREERQKLTAINLLNMNMDISFIEKATGLSKEDILKLKDMK